MERKLCNIFLHFLNKDTQEIFGISGNLKEENIRKVQRGVNASVLLCEEYCFLPLGFYFESELTKTVLCNCAPYIDRGLIRFCMRESEIQDYLSKKRSQLSDFSNDKTYESFFRKAVAKELEEMGPVILQRTQKVGDYCVEKWIEQGSIFSDTGKGDLTFAVEAIKEYNSAVKIVSSLTKIAKNARDNNKAFVWKPLENDLKRIGVRPKVVYDKARLTFEKYYYQVYLGEYNASLLSNYYLIDRNINFNIFNENVSIYSWFVAFLECLDVDKILDMDPEEICAINNFPSFICLKQIYVGICNSPRFECSVSSIKQIVSEKIINNEDSIKDLAQELKEKLQGLNKSIIVEEVRKVGRGNLVDVLVLLATEEEEKSILGLIKNVKEERTEEGHTYYSFNSKMKYAIARASEMRETSTATTGQYYYDLLKPRYLAMVGFAAGQKGKTRLGDVIVPSKIYRYGIGKQIDEDILINEMDEYRIDPIWLQKVERFGDDWRKDIDEIERPSSIEKQEYQFINDMSEKNDYVDPKNLWNAEIMPDYPQIVSYMKEKKYVTEKGGKIKITKSGKLEFERRKRHDYWNGFVELEPKTKVGVLATGDNVQEWEGIFKKLEENYDRKTIALDMEAHAIGNLASFNRTYFIVAKGIGDFAEKNKKFDNRYIQYSTYMAFKFIINFFDNLEIEEM